MVLKNLIVKSNQTEEIEQTVLSIQMGNQDIENYFINKYIPFIKKVTAGVCKRYINPSRDDEFSIAMIAFSEAIHHYSSNKGSSFLSFANLVIRRRVIDYIRMEQRRRTPLSFDYKDEEKENMENLAEVAASFQTYHTKLEKECRQEEILHFQERLQSFGIKLTEVANQCPKHYDARINMIEISRIIMKHDDILHTLLVKKRLPVNQLMAHISMSRKTIERNRKYIIAMVIVFNEDYYYLKDYLKEWF
ncbi:RNA polymerase sigma-I factor [Salipaludibacillus neizhouensis]|uniref:RNA polymerase sigma factor SigI n=1 Tax=Salipaludibacillus neizhouensis TaxID=885475 RepID=A0A3A9K7Q9_9BACI|nr:RNA polymerase sigma-I factor [Salipaludibacillus neizhouensis]RKL67528.1 RNA polymerase sigma-I factor [Salipaludibacillus neizhouensis]